jgi:hypothetical protein
MRFFDDPCRMPGTDFSPEELLAHSQPLSKSIGQAYVERRGISVEVANAAGVRFDEDFNGRPAVLIGLRNREDILVSVHGRYLQTIRGQNKMLTIGHGRGVISLLGGWRVEPLILVEGLFDALSLAQCGVASVATIGRFAPWLPEVAAGRVVWLAFDASRPGEADVSRYKIHFCHSEARRIIPPPHSKDWNTALVKQGRACVSGWIKQCISMTRESD